MVFKTKGTCSSQISFDIVDGKYILHKINGRSLASKKKFKKGVAKGERVLYNS